MGLRRFLVGLLAPAFTAQDDAASVSVRAAASTAMLAELAVVSGAGIIRFGDGNSAHFPDWSLAHSGTSAATVTGATEFNGSAQFDGTVTVKRGMPLIVGNDPGYPANISINTGTFLYKDDADTTHVASLDYSTGAPRLALGGGGAAAPDWTLTRSGTATATIAGGLTISGVTTLSGSLNVSPLKFTSTDHTNIAGLSSGSTVHHRCDSSGGTFTITLPSAPSTGQLFIIEDSTGACGANPVTIARNGNTIGGAGADLSLNFARGCFMLMYDGLSDWKILSRPEFQVAQQPLDSDLTAIAALAPADDDIIQRKSGAWVNRTIAQLKADIANSHVIPHTFAVGGNINVPVGDVDYIPPFFVSVPAGHTAKLRSLTSRINSGTSATFSVKINGVNATGFTGISATTTTATTDPADITLADGDMIAIVVTSVSGTPKNLSASLFVEYS